MENIEILTLVLLSIIIVLQIYNNYIIREITRATKELEDI